MEAVAVSALQDVLLPLGSFSSQSDTGTPLSLRLPGDSRVEVRVEAASLPSVDWVRDFTRAITSRSSWRIGFRSVLDGSSTIEGSVARSTTPPADRARRGIHRRRRPAGSAESTFNCVLTRHLGSFMAVP